MNKFTSELVTDDGRKVTVVWAWSEEEQCAYMLDAWDAEGGFEIPVMSFTEAEVDRFTDFIGALDPFPPYTDWGF
ncbi:hypothetical protein [Nitratireductor luteus]|uniref:hypothetical protein n=1 Tax=Nitratireductor luteus TaxID=2976980 RepID=UPI00223FC889|nr:hypothetical protein [Nitratireductor luteus]